MATRARCAAVPVLARVLLALVGERLMSVAVPACAATSSPAYSAANGSFKTSTTWLQSALTLQIHNMCSI